MTNLRRHRTWISTVSVCATATLVLAVLAAVRGVAATPSLAAQRHTEKVLYNFTGGKDGAYPYGNLVADPEGNLYGTTFGFRNQNSFGAVFRVSKSGNFTVLHSFAGPPTDGFQPVYTSLVMDKTGNLYGVTYDGGSSPNCGTGGCGVVFKIDTSGTETVLHSFNGGSSDGCQPAGTLAIWTTTNSLYGTTEQCGSTGFGTVWKLSENGTEKVLYTFCSAPNCTDGRYPFAGGVILDAKGNLYGVTQSGGTYQDGVVYKLSQAGKETVLHSFEGSDGSLPFGNGLIGEASGVLYGTAALGGNSNYGTVWKLTK